MANTVSAQVEFRDHLAATQSLGTNGASVDVDCPFTTYQALREFWTTHRIREAVGVNNFEVQNISTIQDSYLCVFSTLVLIDRVQWIRHIIRYLNLSDVYLPFCSSTTPPCHWPTRTDWNLFYEAQWQFCARPFEKAFLMSDLHLEEDQILPIIEKTLLKKGDSSNTFRVKLHNHLNQLTDPHNPGGAIVSEFVLKIYYAEDAEQSYTNEVSAYKRLAHRKHVGRNVTHFHGSWRQGKTYNILLEYAGQGTLLDYFQNTPPPTRSCDIVAFWKNMLDISAALQQIHAPLRLIDEGPVPFQGIHQDIKPDNILVVNGEGSSRYDVVFKLADFGLSHFKPVGQDQIEVESADGYGSLMYSAPECCRFDRHLQHTELAVTPKIDIWSWGCVLSEAATWVVLGEHGRKEYAECRRAETDSIRDLAQAGYSGCFHDGVAVLPAVSEMHARLLRERRVSDEKLEHIIMLIKGMLEHESTRPKASEVYRNIRRILREEEDHHYMSSLRMRKATPPQLPPRPTPPRLTPHNTPKNPPQTPPQLPSGASGLNIFNTDIHLQDSLGRNGSAGLYNSPGPSSGNRPFPEHLSQLASPQLSFIRSPRDSPGLRTIYGPPSQGHNSFGFSPVAERTPSVHNALHNNRQNGHPSTATFPASPIRSSTTNTTQDSNERISIQDVLNWSARSRSGKLPAVLEEIKGRLIRRDHVFLIDDAASMRPSWPSVTRVFQALAWIVKRADPDGIDLYFTSDAKSYNSRHRKELIALIDNKKPVGSCDMKFALGQIVKDFSERLKSTSERSRRSRLSMLSPTVASKSVQKRGLSIYVLTDGVWQPDPDDLVCGVEQPIRQLIKKLKDNGQLDTDVAIQFIRFGNDQTGIKRLRILDSHLQEYFDDIDWDIVDTTGYDDDVPQMLLGGLDRSRDRKNDKPSRDKNDMPDRDKMNDMPLAAISRHQSRRSGGHPQGYYDTVASS